MKSANAKNWIWRIARPYGWSILLLSVINGLIAGGMVLFALASRWVIDIATGEEQGDLWLAGGVLVGLLLGELLLNVLYNYYKVWITGKVEIRIKDTVFAALFEKKWSDVSSFHSGELLHRMTADTDVVVSGVVTLIPQVTAMATRLIACLVVLLAMDWRFTLLLLGLGALMLISSRFYGKKMKKLHKECQEKDGKVKAFTQESLANWMLIQSFDGADTVRGRLGGLLDSHFRVRLKRIRWNNMAHAAMYLLFSGSYYVALLWGAVRLAAGTLTYGMLTAFLQIVGQIRQPFVNASGLLPQYYNMLASAERIQELELLEDEPRIEQTCDTHAIYEKLVSLDACDVHFSYEEGHPILVGADFSLKKGEFVALAGFSGIGKSTLMKLMLGFYTPHSGQVCAHTAEGTVTLGRETRSLFAYVPQQSMLLSGTIRENIAFCCGEVSDEAIWAAAEVADVADAIRKQPNGLDTVLGERGSGLSEGQLQRLAIARAVLGGSPVLLLDEATASLDEATEERVLARLRALPDRTCLCISHRPAALEICDRVIRVEDGKIVEG